MNLLISVGCGMMVVSRQSSRHKMWTEITRPKYEREGQRYASDVTDAEWALIEPHMPAAKPLGRPRDTELRAVLDAILYIARTGCQWRMLPRGHRQSIGQDHRERWAAGVRCGQEGQRPQAPHCDRYRRSAGWCRGAPRRCPRSRWRRAGHRGDPPVVSLAAPSLRRQRLQRPQPA